MENVFFLFVFPPVWQLALYIPPPFSPFLLLPLLIPCHFLPYRQSYPPWECDRSHSPRKKTNLGESLAGSHAYNPIRDSLARKVPPTLSPKVPPRVSARLSARLLARLSARLLARVFAPKSLAKSLAESLGSDYMHDSRRDSLWDSVFLCGSLLCCSAFARGHRETAENQCRYSRPFNRVGPQSNSLWKINSRSAFWCAGRGMAVTHPSTDPANTCLTWVIAWHWTPTAHRTPSVM